MSSEALRWDWLNEPPVWKEADGVLSVVTSDKTDFCRETHYGFIHDNGHFRYREVTGDFTATLEFSGAYKQQYDQAGIMLRLDERNWIKAGVEFVDGRQTLGAVVTCDFSDWSTMPLPEDPGWLTLRCQRNGSSVQIEWNAGRNEFKLLRLAYLPPSASVRVGLDVLLADARRTRSGLPAARTSTGSRRARAQCPLGLERQSLIEVL